MIFGSHRAGDEVNLETDVLAKYVRRRSARAGAGVRSGRGWAVQRIEPVFPDLLPLAHRLGPAPRPGGEARLDPVDMRLVRRVPKAPRRRGERVVPRRPVPLLAHAQQVREKRLRRRLLDGGAGCWSSGRSARAARSAAAAVPGAAGHGASVLLRMWGGKRLVDPAAWRRRGAATGVLIGLGPAPPLRRELARAMRRAETLGYQFVLSMPLALPPRDRHKAYDRFAGENGNGELEDLLVHSDLAALTLELERETARVSRRVGLAEGLPGPATAATPAGTFAASAGLLLWARRLDLLDGVGSPGWQLRRAARALFASGRDPRQLVAEDNLRIVPGFTPWVESFARSLWTGRGAPFEGCLARWLAR
jgi:hypothetical protein